MPLKEYQQKRRFTETPEPKGRLTGRTGGLRFVIQEHHARRTHWDFRLEMGGALKSWAVPKGPTLDPGEKRLAVPVEDHPVEYLEFEGVIPEGNYGAGTVMVWDTGTYAMVEGKPLEGFNDGKLSIILHGKKLRGEFHLVRTTMRGETQWLMFKKRDADAISGWTLPSPSLSVKTGRTIEQIKADASAQWQPDRGSRVARQRGGGRTVSAGGGQRRPSGATALPRQRATDRQRKALAALGLGTRGSDPFPRGIKPTLATLVEESFDDPRWLFEIKWDGIRAIAYVRRQGSEHHVEIRSRSGLVVNRQFPEVVHGLYSLGLPDAVLDGEIVALDPQGRSQFQLLQTRIHTQGADVSRAAQQISIAYYVFDLLYLNGHLLLDRPLSERRRALEAVLPPHPVIRLSEAMPARGRAFYQAAQRLGVEGIVGKRHDSAYHPGRRTPSWVKIKVKQRLEAVVGGYTRGRGARANTFGALLLGAYDAGGALQHIGHCGGGFTDAELRRVFALLRTLTDSACPFNEVPVTNERATWVRPELVVEVEYGGWTGDGLLRFPVYKGFRDDKSARGVVLERPVRREPGSKGTEHGRAVAGGRGSAVTGKLAKHHVVARSRATAIARLRAGASNLIGRTLSNAKIPLEFTNLDKIFWPDRGYTKGDLIHYYLEVSQVILPHLRARPITLRRFPHGITGESFYQKDYPDAPPFVRLVKIWTESGKGTLAAPVCNDLPTLLWLAQLADIEIHTWFSRITPSHRAPDRTVRGRAQMAPDASTDFADSGVALHASVLNRPDYVVFDIDPYLFPDGKLPTRKGEKDPDYSRRGFDAATEAALLLRQVLKTLHLESFVKTSGKTGLHVFVPLARRYTFEQTHAFAKTVTQYLEGQHPKKVTTAWAAERRVGKVFLDYNQNRLGATLASAYSIRPTPEATVSMPVTWKELERGLDPLGFTLKTVPDLMRKRRDPWRDLLAKPQLLERHL